MQFPQPALSGPDLPLPQPAYQVKLEDAPDLPSKVRIKAETTFAASLERALGGAPMVATTYRAWLAANESSASDLDQETAARAVKWPRAAEQAQQAAFRDLGEFPGAHFDIRLQRS